MTIQRVQDEQFDDADFWVKVGAKFYPATAGWIIVGGVWKRILFNPFTLTASGYNWNALDAFRAKYGIDPPAYSAISITVPPGSKAIGRPATRFSSPKSGLSLVGLPVNSDVDVHVYGEVVGSAGMPGFPVGGMPPAIAEGVGQVTRLITTSDKEIKADRVLFTGWDAEMSYLSTGSFEVVTKSRLKMAFSNRPDGTDGGHAIESDFPFRLHVYPGHAIRGGGGGGGGIGHARILYFSGIPLLEEWNDANTKVSANDPSITAPDSSGIPAVRVKNSGFSAQAHDSNTYTARGYPRETVVVGVPGTPGCGGLPLDCPALPDAAAQEAAIKAYFSEYDPVGPAQPQTIGDWPYNVVVSGVKQPVDPEKVDTAYSASPMRVPQSVTLLYLGNCQWTLNGTAKTGLANNYGDVQILDYTNAYISAVASDASADGINRQVSQAKGYNYASRLALDLINWRIEAYTANALPNTDPKAYANLQTNSPEEEASTTVSPILRVEHTTDNKRVTARHIIRAGVGGSFGAAAAEQSAQILGYTGALSNGVTQGIAASDINQYMFYYLAAIRNSAGLGLKQRPRLSGSLTDLSTVSSTVASQLANLRTYLLNLTVSNSPFTGSPVRKLGLPNIPYTVRFASRTFNWSYPGGGGSSVTYTMTGITTKPAGFLLADEMLVSTSPFTYVTDQGNGFFFRRDPPSPKKDYTVHMGATPALPVQPCYMGRAGTAGKAVSGSVTVVTHGTTLNAQGAVG